MPRAKLPKQISPTHRDLHRRRVAETGYARELLMPHRRRLEKLAGDNTELFFDTLVELVANYRATKNIGSTPRENLHAVERLIAAIEIGAAGHALEKHKTPFRTPAGGIENWIYDDVHPALHGDPQYLHAILKHHQNELATHLDASRKLRGENQAVRYLCGALRIAWQSHASQSFKHDVMRRRTFVNKLLQGIGLERQDDARKLDSWINTEINCVVPIGREIL